MEKHEAGTATVYLNYGVHRLFNILVNQREVQWIGPGLPREYG